MVSPLKLLGEGVGKMERRSSASLKSIFLLRMPTHASYTACSVTFARGGSMAIAAASVSQA